MSRAVVDTGIKTDLVQEKDTSHMRAVQRISPGVILGGHETSNRE
jgi:predicted nucleic acid-binding protein